MSSYIHTELQVVGDAAALAGARELALANTTGQAVAGVVKRNIEVQADMAGRGPVTSAVDVDLETADVTVDLELAWAPFFAHFIQQDITPVKSHSQARLLATNTKICVLTLAPYDDKAIFLNDRAMLTADGCGVYANSSSVEAIRLDMDSRMAASLICSAGGVKAAKHFSVTPEPTTDCPEIADPLAGRFPPDASGCDFTATTVTSGSTTLTPGVYCGGLEITNTAHVHFAPGVYTITGGPLKISDSALAEGEGVGFYLDGTHATLDFSGEAAIRLSGPESGTMAGLLFFEDRAAPLKRKHRINAAHADTLVGTIYLSRGLLYVDPNAAVAEKSAYTAIIAYQLQLEQGPELVLNSDYESTSVPVPEGIKGKSVVILTE